MHGSSMVMAGRIVNPPADGCEIACGVSLDNLGRRSSLGLFSKHVFTEHRVVTAEVLQRPQLLMQGSVSAASVTLALLLRR